MSASMTAEETHESKESHTKRRPSPDMRAKENGYSDADRESGPPPAKRHQPLLSPTIRSRISPSGLAPLLLHASGHSSGHSNAHTNHSSAHSHHVSTPSVLHSHLSTSARSMFDDPSNTSASALYHNVANSRERGESRDTRDSRESATNGRPHSSAELLSDRYSTAAERFEREYCRPAAGLYTGLQRDYSDDRDMEDEWKNIHTMLNCILGMVEKTKRALAILQHRSDAIRPSEYATSMWNLSNMRARHFNPLEVSHSSHEFHELKKPRVDNLMSSVHYPKGNLSDIDRLSDYRRGRSATNHQRLEDAINEVKRQAVAELQKAVSAAETKANELVANERSKMEKLITDARRQAAEETLTVITHQEESTENCWNCGRKASETCSGCNVARYCGSFCQHKDWENHHRVCQNTCANGSNGSLAQTSVCGEKRSQSHSPTPAPSSATLTNVGKGCASAASAGAGDSVANKKSDQ